MAPRVAGGPGIEHPGGQSRRHAFEAGFDDDLEKPVKPEELVSLVWKHGRRLQV